MTITTDVTWNRLRELVKKRDGAKCFHCGKIDQKGHCDHLLPLAKGGTDSILNLVWSCPQCNWKKGSSLPELEDNPEFSINESNLKREESSHRPNLIKKIFIDLFIEIIYFLIPPYPKFGNNFYNILEYYLHIETMVRFSKSATWLRHKIYPIPEEVLSILICLESYDNIESMRNRIKPEDYKFSFEVCRICNSKVEVNAPNGYINFMWECEGGHGGEGSDIFADDSLETIKLYHIKLVEREIERIAKKTHAQGHLMILVNQFPEDDIKPYWLKTYKNEIDLGR